LPYSQQLARHACPHRGQGIGHEAMVRRANFQRPQLRVLNQRVGFKSGFKIAGNFFFDTIKTDYLKLKKDHIL